jgi:CHAT domain-containing protein
LLTGSLATENALKAARSPALLHLATHGFFLEDPHRLQKGTGLQEPLLRSGIALAGFNARASGSEDGVLTALEAQSLDLEGTELAVLSACQSGAGLIVGGEGVQGLRRALALAGARSQVLTLWPVEDRTTAALMERFYRGLASGLGRSEALRQAQLAVSAQPGRSHPYWWASFAASGDWRPVQRFARGR